MNSISLDDLPGDSLKSVLFLLAGKSPPNWIGNLNLLLAPRAEFSANAVRKQMMGDICGLSYDMKRSQSSCRKQNIIRHGIHAK